MWVSPPELPSIGSLRLNNSSRQHFLVRAVEYAVDKLPLKDALLKHAKCVDVQLRAECGVDDALYFVDRQGLSHTDNIFKV